MKKLNLGCGPTGINGWINYDFGMLPFLNKTGFLGFFVKLGLLKKDYLLRWPKFEMVDIRKVLPLEDKTIDYIYCSHVLEHFEKWEAKNILLESRRVLKTGGIIRIVLPDIEKIINNYSATKSDEFCRIWWGYDKDIKPKSFFDKLSRLFIRGHQWMYNKVAFKEILKECGFRDIRLLSIGKGNVPDIKKLDLELHKELSFYYEAKK